MLLMELFRILTLRQCGQSRRLLMTTLLEHRRRGSPVPPPHLIKLYWILSLASRYKARAFVETGTCLGATVDAVKDQFRQVFSIELDDALWAGAVSKFAHCPHVSILHGNSASVLPRIMPGITDRVLFWLDGHYSGGITARGDKDTPIVEELEAVGSHVRKDHVILIDDARLFVGKDGYPTLEDTRRLLYAINPRYRIRVVDDIIQACP